MLLLEVQALGRRVQSGLEGGAIQDMFPPYCLYRAGVEKLIQGQGWDNYWGFKQGVYRIGSLMQRSLTNFIAESAADPKATKELVSYAQERIPKITQSGTIPQFPVNEWLQTTVSGAAGTALSATLLERFIESGWECAGVDLDVDYGVDVFYPTEGSTVQSKVAQANNYRNVNNLPRTIVKEGVRTNIRVLRLVWGNYELQFAPIALVPFAESQNKGLTHVSPNVLNTGEDRQVLAFSEHGAGAEMDLAEAVLTAAQLIAENQKEPLPEDEPEEPFSERLKKRIEGLRGLDNFEILMHTKRLQNLTSFGKDITRSVLLCAKAKMEGKFPYAGDTPPSPLYYTETAMYDLRTLQKPETLEFAVACCEFIQGVRNLEGYSFRKAAMENQKIDTITFQTEELPVINL